MDPIISAHSQALPGGLASLQKPGNPGNIPGDLKQSGLERAVGKLQEVKSFDDVYNLGVNNRRSSLSGPSAASGPFSTEGISGFIQEVDAKAKEASRLRAEVVTGNSAHLHRAMIASEEASVSFKLLLEMRNKLLETYQELMRLQV